MPLQSVLCLLLLHSSARGLDEGDARRINAERYLSAIEQVLSERSLTRATVKPFHSLVNKTVLWGIFNSTKNESIYSITWESGDTSFWQVLEETERDALYREGGHVEGLRNRVIDLGGYEERSLTPVLKELAVDREGRLVLLIPKPHVTKALETRKDSCNGVRGTAPRSTFKVAVIPAGAKVADRIDVPFDAVTVVVRRPATCNGVP